MYPFVDLSTSSLRLFSVWALFLGFLLLFTSCSRRSLSLNARNFCIVDDEFAYTGLLEVYPRRWLLLSWSFTTLLPEKQPSINWSIRWQNRRTLEHHALRLESTLVSRNLEPSVPYQGNQQELRWLKTKGIYALSRSLSPSTIAKNCSAHIMRWYLDQ